MTTYVVGSLQLSCLNFQHCLYGIGLTNINLCYARLLNYGHLIFLHVDCMKLCAFEITNCMRTHFRLVVRSSLDYHKLYISSIQNTRFGGSADPQNLDSPIENTYPP